MSTKASELREKEFYHELTDKQQRVVDAIVENPDASNTKLADLADVSRPYVSTVREAYGNVIESKINERDEGEMTTEGDPFTELEEDLVEEAEDDEEISQMEQQYEQLHEQAGREWQYIGDRPEIAAKESAPAGVATEGAEAASKAMPEDVGDDTDSESESADDDTGDLMEPNTIEAAEGDTVTADAETTEASTDTEQNDVEAVVADATEPAGDSMGETAAESEPEAEPEPETDDTVRTTTDADPATGTEVNETGEETLSFELTREEVESVLEADGLDDMKDRIVQRLIEEVY